MGIGARHLQVWTGQESLGPDPCFLPTPAEALYAFPNPNGEGKRCGNCVLYARGDQQCYVHARDMKISETQVCGYHVAGQPSERFEQQPQNLDPVTPEYSGLTSTESGAYCGICEHFDSGSCFALQENGQFAEVEDMACCTRWRPRAASSS